VIDVEAPEFEAPFGLRFATPSDLRSVARLFAEAFSAHAVSSLSTPLQQKFIALHAQLCVTLVAVELETGRVLGFAIGGRYEQLDRARQAFIHGNVIPLALHALTRRETYRAAHLRLPSRTSRRERASPSAGHELRYLAVAAGERGCGIGSALLQAMEREMLIDQPYFVWALSDRASALQFYFRHGFREEYRIDGHVRLIKGDSRSEL
jgi:GNAT superfamily N-acetyltransferase